MDSRPTLARASLMPETLIIKKTPGAFEHLAVDAKASRFQDSAIKRSIGGERYASNSIGNKRGWNNPEIMQKAAADCIDRRPHAKCASSDRTGAYGRMEDRESFWRSGRAWDQRASVANCTRRHCGHYDPGEQPRRHVPGKRLLRRLGRFTTVIRREKFAELENAIIRFQNKSTGNEAGDIRNGRANRVPTPADDA